MSGSGSWSSTGHSRGAQIRTSQKWTQILLPTRVGLRTKQTAHDKPGIRCMVTSSSHEAGSWAELIRAFEKGGGVVSTRMAYNRVLVLRIALGWPGSLQVPGVPITPAGPPLFGSPSSCLAAASARPPEVLTLDRVRQLRYYLCIEARTALPIGARR